MLPTGHVAAGFITAYSFVKIVKPDLDPSQINQLFYFGALFGFLPDLDEFWFFFKTKSLLVAPAGQKISHRHYLSHTPALWLIAGVIIFVFSSSVFWQSIGLLLWLCSWSHFLTDTVENGIMWFWPVSRKLLALKNKEVSLTIPERNFFKHSFTFLKLYTARLSFYLEIVLIVLTLLILLNINLY